MIRWGVKKRVPPDKYWGRLYYVGAGSKHWYRQRRAGPTIRGRLLMPAKTGETDGGDDRQLVEETTSFWSFKWRRLCKSLRGRIRQRISWGRLRHSGSSTGGCYATPGKFIEETLSLWVVNWRMLCNSGDDNWRMLCNSRQVFIEETYGGCDATPGKYSLRRHMEDAMQLRTIFIEATIARHSNSLTLPRGH